MLTMEQEEALNVWLNENYRPFESRTPGGRVYVAYPIFSRLKTHASLANDMMAEMCEFEDGWIRIRQYSPHQGPGDTTGTYAVCYEFFFDADFDQFVALMKSFAKCRGELVLDALRESLTEDQLAHIGENLFVSERNPL